MRGILFAALLLALSPLLGCHAPAPTTDHEVAEPACRLIAIRDATSDDRPFEERTSALRPPVEPNDVVGPDSLRAFVRTNADSRPQLYLEDLRTRTTMLLFPGFAFQPRWSPDGRFLACTEWKSVGRYSDLTIISVLKKEVLASPISSTTAEKKWAPDSHALLVAGIRYGVGHAILYRLTVPDLAELVVDESEVVAGYEMSWSPDSEWIVFARPTAIEPTGGDTVAADVWIASSATGRKLCLLETPQWIEAHPLWVTNRSILIERTYWNGTNFGTTERKVLEIEFSS